MLKPKNQTIESRTLLELKEAFTTSAEEDLGDEITTNLEKNKDVYLQGVNFFNAVEYIEEETGKEYTEIKEVLKERIENLQKAIKQNEKHKLYIQERKDLLEYLNKLN